MSDRLTILRTTPSSSGGKRFATKHWIWMQALGEWRSISYDAGGFFTAEERSVASLNDVAATVEAIRGDPAAFLVRGALTKDAREAVAHNPRYCLRRRKRQGKKGEAPTLVEVPRQWLMVDVDGYPLPDWADLATEPEEVVARAIHDLLPECFHHAQCFWQLSASAGFKAGFLKVHLFFWLSEPIANQDLKLFLQAYAPGVDRSPYNAAQPHYVADPIVENGHDPISQRTGWCKGLDDVVVLPVLDLTALRAIVARRRERVVSGTGLDARTAGTVAAATALLGDDEGHEGFHAPLRRATWLYARQTSPHQRDDAALKAELRQAIRATAGRPDGSGKHSPAELERYCSDAYLDPLLDGAFHRIAQDRSDAPEGMTPFHATPGFGVEKAREQLRGRIEEVLRDATAWHATDAQERGKPKHIGLAVDVATGKSGIGRRLVAELSRAQREKGGLHRILWLVPTIKLGSEAEEHFAGLEDVTVAVHRGREQDDPNRPGEKMCLDLPAVQLAIGAGENVDEAVCGGRENRCRLFEVCGYQRQRASVKDADIVIGAHELAFHLPASIKTELALTVFDEAWWQDGLALGRAVAVDGLAGSVIQHPVWHRGTTFGGLRQNLEGTHDLYGYRAALERALTAAADGYLRRDTLVAAGLTAEMCASARKLEWDRKRPGLMRPGMSYQARQQAAEEAGINVQIPRFSTMWTILNDLLSSDAEATGRAELEWQPTKEGDRRVLMLNTKRDVSGVILEKPILLLDATMPVDLVRSYLPDLEAAEPVRVRAPHMRLHQVVGGFGKTSIVPYGEPETSENRRRRNLAGSLRDLIENETRGTSGWTGGPGTLVVTYQGLEEAFQGIPGVETAHFNNMAGHDRWRGVRNLFVIGRPLPPPDAIRQLAAALTGAPVEVSQSHRAARAVRMADGTGGTVEVRAYEDPQAEAVRAAITDAEVVQAIGRARGVNRTASDPVRVWLMADVVTPLVVDRLSHWRDLAPSDVQRMAMRGFLLTGPADAAKAFPDLFKTPKAAEHALKRAGVNPRGISPPFPYEKITS